MRSAQPGPLILSGQAGGIVTLIFDLVTLSNRAPACPAKLTRPRALRRALVVIYRKMRANINKILLQIENN